MRDSLLRPVLRALEPEELSRPALGPPGLVGGHAGGDGGVKDHALGTLLQVRSAWMDATYKA